MSEADRTLARATVNLMSSTFGRSFSRFRRYSGSCPAWPSSFTPGWKTHTSAARASRPPGRIHTMGIDRSTRAVTRGISRPSGLHVAGCPAAGRSITATPLDTRPEGVEYGTGCGSKHPAETRYVLPGLFLFRVLRIARSKPKDRTRGSGRTLNDAATYMGRCSPTIGTLPVDGRSGKHARSRLSVGMARRHEADHRLAREALPIPPGSMKLEVI